MNLDVNLSPKSGYLPAQRAACALAEDPKGPTWTLLSGGQGAGKSLWLVWELLRLHFINVQSVVASGGKPEDVWGLLLSPTHALLRKGLGLTLEQVLYESGLGGRYSWNRQDGILQFDFGGGLYTFTAEKPERIISVTVSEAAIDEPGTSTKPDAIQRIPGRLRGPGLLRKAIMAGTPEDIVTRQWFYEFIASPEAQAKYGIDGDNSRRVVFASTRENHFIRDLASFVSGQESVLTKAQQLAYIEGQFTAFNVGRVYSGFIDRSVDNGGHRIPRGHELMNPPGEGNPLLVTIDFNVDPMCGVIAFPLIRDGVEVGVRVLDEVRIPKQGAEEGETPIGRWTREVVGRWVAGWKGAVHVYGDATAERANVAASKTGWALVHEALRPIVQGKGLDYHVHVPLVNPREIDRVNTVNAAFERGEVLVAEDCTFTRTDLNLVGFKPGTSEIDKTTDKSLTHLSDALGYLICQRRGIVASRAAAVLPRILVPSVPAAAETFDW